VAPDARWLSVCQAREDTNGDGRVSVGNGDRGDGDRTLRYLEFASGEEQVIDELLASSPDGRWLVLRLQGHVELYDSLSGTRRDLTALGADTRSEPNEIATHRVLAFTPTTLFYVRTRDDGAELVRQTLEDGSERVLYTSPDPIARLRLDPAGKLATLNVARAQNAKNGRFIWPHRLDDAPSPCRTPLSRYLAPNPAADAFSTVVVDIETGHAELVEGLAGIYGDAVVRREADGSLWIVRGKARHRVSDKTCAGRLLLSDVASETLLVGCVIEKRPGRLNVVAISGNGRKSLNVELERQSLDIEVALLGDEPVRPSERLVTLYPGADCVLFDTQKRELHRLRAGDVVLDSAGARALVRRGKTLLFFDADTGTETALPETLDAFATLIVSGPLVFATPWVIDVQNGRVLGRVSGKGLALSNAGAVLVPATTATDQTLDEGPLTWRTPE
jgi:hypothetical protein